MRTPHVRPSIADVARAAGVSLGSVSNVLNRPDAVSAATREKVEAAIAELGFVRNDAARRLRSGRPSVVGAIVLDLGNPFYADLASGIEDRLTEAGLALMLASSREDPERERRYLRLFAEHGVGGVLAAPTHGTTDALLRLARGGIRVVLLDHHSPEPDLPAVAADNVHGASLAVGHLLESGHRHIALLNGPHSQAQHRDRHEGALAAVAAAGLPAAALQEVVLPSQGADDGARAAADLLALSDPPTAIFCVNDMLALGVLRTLRARGVAVPQQVAVVGYDDVAFAGELAVPLTSVRQPAYQMGAAAAELLLAEDGPRQVDFPPELIVRASSAPASAGA